MLHAVYKEGSGDAKTTNPIDRREVERIRTEGCRARAPGAPGRDPRHRARVPGAGAPEDAAEDANRRRHGRQAREVHVSGSAGGSVPPDEEVLGGEKEGQGEVEGLKKGRSDAYRQLNMNFVCGGRARLAN